MCSVFIVGGILINAIGPFLIISSLSRISSPNLASTVASSLFPAVGYIIWLSGVLIFIIQPLIDFFFKQFRTFKVFDFEITFDEIKDAQEKAQQQPDKLAPLWDLGRLKFELYIDRNLSQNRWIFFFSVGVMIAGFILIILGIWLTFTSGSTSSNGIVTPAAIGTLSGIITEFIGATFLFIYRTTMKQSDDYVKMLERFNSISIAVNILDSIPDEHNTLKSDTRAKMAYLLLSRVSDLSLKELTEQIKVASADDKKVDDKTP